MTKEHLENRSGDRRADNRIQLQLHGRRWRRQFKIELDGEKWSVAYVPLGATKCKLRKSGQELGLRLTLYSHSRQDCGTVKL